MKSKLGLGPGIYRDGQDVRELANLGFRLAFFMDEGLKAAHLFQNCLRIGRYYLPAIQQGFGDSADAARVYGTLWADIINQRTVRQGVWDDIEVWTAYCEANHDNDGSFTWEKQWAFLRGFAERMHELGKKAAGPDNSVGSGNVADFLTPEAIACLGILDYHTSHDYGPEGPDLMMLDTGWYTRRWQKMAKAVQEAGHRFPPHISTESGVYGNLVQPTGWKGVHEESVIIEDFRWLAARIQEHPLWEGACLYLMGTPDPDKWRNWEYLGTSIIPALPEINKIFQEDPAPTEEEPMAETEYGFAGLFDGFDELVGRIGAQMVGKPLHGARYLGGDYAYQVTENGRLEAVKLDDGSWDSRFYETYRPN